MVGDIVFLEAGEKIPADGVLIQGALRVDESALNGESKETRKEATDEEKRRILYRGAVVSEGEGIMLVQKVGDDTGELQGETVDSPMKIRLTHLARQLSILGYTAAALIAFADLFHAIVIENQYNTIRMLSELKDLPLMAQNLVHALLLAISVVVMAVPEGLPPRVPWSPRHSSKVPRKAPFRS